MKKLLRWLKRISISLLLVLSVILLPILITKGYEKLHALFLTDQERWLEDIHRISYLMQNEFAAFDKFTTTEEFDARIEILRKRVLEDTTFTEESFQLETIKLVASFKDPHTLVYNFRETKNLTLPYRLEWYDGAFYLTAGKIDDSAWLGTKVVGIDNQDPVKFYHQLKSYTNAPNEASHAYFLTMFLPLPSILYYEGLIQDKSKISLTVENGTGESRTFVFNSITQEEKNQLTDYQTLSKRYRDSEKPLFRTRPNENYWYEFLEEEDVLYLRYQQCVAQGDIEAFWNQLIVTLDERKPKKFIIDLRGNPGGDSKNNISLVNAITQRPWINTEGKLFTIIDRGTGSAAVSLTAALEAQTNTILVGEKTVDRPNTTSDPTFFTLPHSGLTILLPNLFSLHSHVYDLRDGIAPDWPISTSLAGDGYLFDPALDSILNQTVEIESRLMATLPAALSGTYSFSPLRNLSIFQKDTIWMLSIDGLIETPVFINDSVYYTEKYDITVSEMNSVEGELRVTLHGSEIVARRLDEKSKSIVRLIDSGAIQTTHTNLMELKNHNQSSYYLDRPFFQNKVYSIYRKFGLEKAIEYNKINKDLFHGDPVVSIIDYELYQFEGGDFIGQMSASFSIIGKLMKRYYSIITTERIMNDDYNAFIGS